MTSDHSKTPKNDPDQQIDDIELAEYLEGALDPEKTEQIERLLRTNVALQTRLEKLDSFDLDGITEVDVPAGLYELVIARLEVEELIEPENPVHHSAFDSAEHRGFAERILGNLTDLDLVTPEIESAELATPTEALEPQRLQGTDGASHWLTYAFFVFAVISIFSLSGLCLYLLQERRDLRNDRVELTENLATLQSDIDRIKHELPSNDLRSERDRLLSRERQLLTEIQSLKRELKESRRALNIQSQLGNSASVAATAMQTRNMLQQRALDQLTDDFDSVSKQSKQQQASLEILSETILKQQKVVESLQAKLRELTDDFDPGFLVSDAEKMETWNSRAWKWESVKLNGRLKAGSLVKITKYNAKIKLGDRTFRPPPGVYLVTERGYLVVIPKEQSQTLPRQKPTAAGAETDNAPGVSDGTGRIIGRILGGR